MRSADEQQGLASTSSTWVPAVSQALPALNYQTIQPSTVVVMPAAGGSSQYLDLESQRRSPGNPQRFNGFSEKSIRTGFMVKVFSILGLQVLFTTLAVAWVMFHAPTREFFTQNYPAIAISSTVVALVLFMLLTCVESARRSHPLNLVLLALLTCAFSVSLAATCANFDLVSVLTAFGSVCLIFFLLVLMALFCPFDLTGCGCALLVVGLIEMLVSVVLVVTLVPAHLSLSMVLTGALGSLLAMLYMLFDLQLIMGDRSHQFSPEDYVLAVICIYIDLINLLQNILLVVGSRR